MSVKGDMALAHLSAGASELSSVLEQKRAVAELPTTRGLWLTKASTVPIDAAAVFVHTAA
jgi:hypothetical protein